MEEEFIEIGKIDISYLKNIFDVKTDKLIITTERISHINKRHRNDFDIYANYIPNVLKEPEYILRDIENDNTILYLKSYEKLNFQVVVKLQVEKEENKCNTVITFWNMRKRSYNQIIKKNGIVFKSIDKNE